MSAPGSSATAAPGVEQDAEGPTGPLELRISELEVNPDRTVRIVGIITAIDGIRLVPPKVIFRVSDSDETITVLIKEQTTLQEGTRIELVGTYQEIPSPVHDGAGEPPRQAVFVVERYLTLP